MIPLQARKLPRVSASAALHKGWIVMLPVLYRIPIITSWTPDGIPIHGYGLMLFLAFILCTWMAGRRGEREGISRETIQDLAIWLFVGGLLGARLTYLLSQPDENLTLTQMLLRLPKIWDGGLVLYGSVIGGLAAYVLAYFLVFRQRGLSTLKLIDVIAPAFAVGLCLGRIGCFLNGCCFGGVACASCFAPAVPFPPAAPPRYLLVQKGWQTMAGFTLALDQKVDQGVLVGAVNPHSSAAQSGLLPGDVILGINGREVSRISDLENALEPWPRGRQWLTLKYRRGQEADRTISFIPWTLGLYPTQLYEVVSMFLLFLVLTAYYPLRRRPGQVMALLMIGYGCHRYLNEILRFDPRPVGLETSVSVILVGLGILLWVTLNFMPLPQEKTPEPKAAVEVPSST
jgi:phosphatidylglycerol:prolipoprotein diacylglycerol transferase